MKLKLFHLMWKIKQINPNYSLKVTTLDKEQLYIHVKRNLRYFNNNLKISEVNIKHVIISYIYNLYKETSLFKRRYNKN